MNWGKWIVIVLIIFVAGITWMTVYFFMSPVDDYDHQYYEKGLSFNHDYDRELQVTKYHAQPTVSIETKQVKFTFAQPVIGIIKFMRPSDAALDKTFHVNSGESREVYIPLEKLPVGNWQIDMEWQSNHRDYLYRQEIYIK